jgi:hypothetical protein
MRAAPQTPLRASEVPAEDELQQADVVVEAERELDVWERGATRSGARIPSDVRIS